MVLKVVELSLLSMLHFISNGTTAKTRERHLQSDDVAEKGQQWRTVMHGKQETRLLLIPSTVLERTCSLQSCKVSSLNDRAKGDTATLDRVFDELTAMHNLTMKNPRISPFCQCICKL